MAGNDSKEGGGWKSLLADLERRRDAARAMGGAEKLSRQHQGGRLDARARIDALLDPGSFLELGTLVGGVREAGDPPTPADALVAGVGRIEGRPVLVGAEDFTVLGDRLAPVPQTSAFGSPSGRPKSGSLSSCCWKEPGTG